MSKQLNYVLKIINAYEKEIDNFKNEWKKLNSELDNSLNILSNNYKDKNIETKNNKCIN